MAKTPAKRDAEGVPAYLQNTKMERTDNFDSGDVVLPQIKLLQGTSDEIQTFDAAKPGHFWHSGADMDLGPEIVFIPCSRKKRYMLMAPMDDGQGVLARADDAKTWDRLGSWKIQVDKKTIVDWKIDDLNVEASGLTKWGTYDPTDENSPPAATLFYDYLVFIRGREELGPAIVLLARSAIRKAKKGLNDKIEMQASAGRPLQSLAFTAQVVPDSAGSGQDFFNWQFRMAGFADENEYNAAKEIHDNLRHYAVADETSHAEKSSDDDDEVPF